MVIYLERGADLHMALRIPLPLTVSCFSKIQIGFTFLVPAHPGSPGQRPLNSVCVCGHKQSLYWPVRYMWSMFYKRSDDTAKCQQTLIDVSCFSCSLLDSTRTTDTFAASQVNLQQSVSHNNVPYLLLYRCATRSSVAASTTMLPEHAVTGLSPWWVDPNVDWLYISINLHQSTSVSVSLSQVVSTIYTYENYLLIPAKRRRHVTYQKWH